MIQMEGGIDIQFMRFCPQSLSLFCEFGSFCLILFVFSQFLKCPCLCIYLVALGISVYHILDVSVVNHGIRCVLNPDIGTERTFSTALESRTVNAICTTVIFPG